MDSIDKEVLSCEVCNLSLDSLENFRKHSLTPEHASKVMKCQATNNATSNQELNTTEYNRESTSEESILPELNDNLSYPSYGSCKVCSKSFSGPEPYKQHLESQAHKKKIALLQNPTPIFLKCDPCNKSFSGQIPYAQHMSSETHKKKLLNIQAEEKYLSVMTPCNSSAGESKVEEKKDEIKPWFCKICNVQCSGRLPYGQHLAGSTHFKKKMRMQSLNDFVEMNGSTTMVQVSNFNDGKDSDNFEKRSQLMNGYHDNGTNQQINNCNDDKLSENVTQVMNNSYQEDNGYDFMFPENFKESVVSTDELPNLVKIIHPDEKIDFDELGKSKEYNPTVTNENENDEAKKIEKNTENDFDGDLKEPEVYQICEICNVSLYDKESVAEHFESKEHVEKKWGLKI